MSNELKLAGIFKPLLLFLLYLLLLRVCINWAASYFGLDSPGIAVNIFLTMAAAAGAMKSQFKRLGRLLTLSEKIGISSSLVAAGTLFDGLMLWLSGNVVEANVAAISLAVAGLLHFLGVWLAISTLAEKFFPKELGLA